MTVPPAAPGRLRQKQRTRRLLIDAATRLVAEGRDPTIEEVAAAAGVSRATAYRYFSSIEALVAEVELLRNEVALHVMARNVADRWLSGGDNRVPRQGERFRWIDAALDGYADDVGPEAVDRLRYALGSCAAWRRCSRRATRRVSHARTPSGWQGGPPAFSWRPR